MKKEWKHYTWKDQEDWYEAADIAWELYKTSKQYLIDHPDAESEVGKGTEKQGG